MRIAISNLAWNIVDDENIVVLLNKYGIDAIDIAPGKYFSNIKNTTDSEAISVKNWWQDKGVSITGMQALLFGTTGLNLFGSNETQNIMLAHLSEICRIGSLLGATMLVFGSPKNRDRSALTDEQTKTIAKTFFRRLGDIAQNYGVLFCLEPNPPCYGANYMTNSSETAQVVEDVAHPSIRMQLDTGAITINEEDPKLVIRQHRDIIGHVHASEPNLIPLGDGGAQTIHQAVASALSEYLPNQVVSIEMLETKDEPPLVAIERAICVAINNYRNLG